MRTENYHRLITESSRDIIATHNMEGIVVYVNPAWTKLTKFDASETIGRHIEDFVDQSSLEKSNERYDQRKSGDESAFAYEATVISKDGEKIPLEVQSSPIQIQEQEIQEILLVCRDLRKQQQANHQLASVEASYQNLFNTIEDAIYIQDQAGRFIDVNRGVEKLYGLPKDAFIGKKADFLAAPGKNDFEFIQEKFRLALSGKPQIFEFWGKRSNGEIFPKEVRLYKGEYFGKEVIIALGREISQRKKAESTLQRQLNELNILQATAFTSSQALDQDTLLRQITNIIGNTLYPDNFGILLLDSQKEILIPHESYQGVSEEDKNVGLPISKGISGKVVSTGKALCVGNVKKISDYEVFNVSTRSELCVPIKIREEIFGVINLESAREDFFSENDLRLLNTIVGQVATSLEKLELFETERKRRQFAERLQESAAILTNTLSQDEAIDLILEELSQVVSFDSASVQLLREGYLEIVGGRGELVLETQKDIRFPMPGDNPNTLVCQQKRHLILDDAPKTYEAFKAMPSIRSWMGVPLIVHEGLIGMLTLDSEEPNHFSEEDAALVSSFANHAAIAIENAKLFKEEKKRREEAEILKETALALTSSLNIEEALHQILDQLGRVLSYDSASVQILHGDELEIFKGRGWEHPEEVENLRFPLDGSNPNTRVIRSKEVVILPDAKKEHAPFRKPPHDHINSWMGIPLIIRDKVVGMLAVDSKEKGYFTKESAELIETFAHQAAIAIENARLFNEEQVRRQEAETLRQAVHTISSSLELGEVLDTVLTSIRQVIPYDSSAILLFKGDSVIIKSGRGLPDMENQIGKRFSAHNGISKKISHSNHPIIIKDAQKEENFQGWAGTSYVRGWMGVPLICRGKVIGYITLDSHILDAYDKKDAELAQTFAYQAATAIENAQLYQDALHAAERRAVLHRLSQDIVRDIQSPEQTYEAVHHAAQQLMQCDAFVISLRKTEDAIDDQAVYLIDKGRRYDKRSIPRKNSIVSYAQSAEGTYLNQDTLAYPLPFEPEKFGAKENIRSLIISPMYVGKTLIGAISVQSYVPHIYDEEEKILLEMLASHAAAAIDNARLFSETKRRAKEFSELYELTQDLVAQQDMDQLLETTLKRATQLLDVSAGDISLYEKKQERLIATSVCGLDQTNTKKALSTYLKKGEGVAGYVAETLQAIHIDDYHAWSKKAEGIADVPITSIISVPMLYAGNLLGVLSLYEKVPETRHFSKSDERILTLFATQVAGAMHSAKQFTQINNRLEELEAINRISTALRSAETPDEMLPVLLDEVSASLHVDVAAIWLEEPGTDEVERVMSRGWVAETHPTRQPNYVGLIGRIFQSGAGHIAPNLTDDPSIRLGEGSSFPENWTGAWVPIHSTEKIIGVIGIMDEHPREFNQDDIRLLTILAEMSGNAIHRARLYGQTEKQVRRLTALRNIDTAINANFDLSVTLQLLITHTVSALNIDAADILLLTSPQQTLTYFVGSGFKTQNFSNSILKMNMGLPGEAILKQRMIFSNTPCKDENCARQSCFQEEKFLSYYCVPLIAKGETLGVLEIFHREKLSPSTEWENFLQALAGQAAIAIDNTHLFENLKHSNEELALAYDTTLEGWGRALELRDPATQGHTVSVTDLTLRLARELGIPESEMVHIHRGALLHDIGKMGVPDEILHKPGPLTKEEWKIMRKHPQFAYEMLINIPYLRSAIDIPYAHHERWDGQGYPRGLKGEEIPLAARIFAVTDVWDALLTDRPYREAWDREAVLDYLRKESGMRFDPKIVDLFIKLIQKI